MDGSHVYRQSDPVSGWRVSQAGEFWSDQVVEARMKVSSFGGSTSGFMAALYGRYDLRPEQSCGYYVALRGDGKLALRKVAGGVDSDLGTAVSAGIVAGRWYSLRLEIVGTTLRAYLNGVLRATQTDSSCTSGGVAVGSQGALFEVDDVLVSPPSQLTSVSLTLPAGVKLGDFTVGGNGTVRISDRVTVKNADGSGAAVINGGVSATDIGVEAVVGNLTSISGVTLRDRAAVWGNVTTAGSLTRQSSTTITGTTTTSAGLGTATVQAWQVSMPVATMGDVTLQPDTSRALAPGSYGSVVLAYSRSTLSLSSGAYYMDALDIEPQAILRLDMSAGPIVMYVRGSVTFRGQLVNVAGSESDFLIVSFGTDDVILESQFTGSILVPNGTLYMNSVSGGYRGAFYGKTMQINPDNTIVTLQFPWDRLTSACSGQDATPRPVGSLCREAASACDLAEKCDGSSFTCPDDVLIADGSACDDGNLCTPTDTCQGGVCTGTGAPACDPIDQCHDRGTCNPLTGVCSTPAKADGSSCSDASVCSQTDTCQAGVCTGGNFKSCVASDQCHTPGCDPATGDCTETVKADGASCDDGVGCTQSDVCTSGTCAGASYTCAAPDQCHQSGTCNGDGTCSYTAKANGTSCDDGNPCTLSDTCQNGVCSGTSVSCTVSGTTVITSTATSSATSTTSTAVGTQTATSGTTSTATSSSTSSTTSSLTATATSTSVSMPTGCTNPITFSGGQSGNFNTTGAVCYRTTATIAGWGCSNFNGRTVAVDNVSVSCGGTMPARWSDGYYYFVISAGTYSYASIYYW
jgi:hypothetical protein